MYLIVLISRLRPLHALRRHIAGHHERVLVHGLSARAKGVVGIGEGVTGEGFGDEARLAVAQRPAVGDDRV